MAKVITEQEVTKSQARSKEISIILETLAHHKKSIDTLKAMKWANGSRYEFTDDALECQREEAYATFEYNGYEIMTNEVEKNNIAELLLKSRILDYNLTMEELRLLIGDIKNLDANGNEYE